MKLAARIFKRTDYYITSKFGYRIHPITGKKTFHSGCDYGTNVSKWKQYALESGEVTSTGKDASSGNYVWIKYPRLGIKLFHCHLDKVEVKKGQKVDENTVIGTTGMTGSATGIHLHLGLKKDGDNNWIDPETYDYKEEVKPEPTPEPTPTPEVEIKLGDIVVVNGRGNGNSGGTSRAWSRTYKNQKMKVILINKGAKYPYALNQYGQGVVGKAAHVTAWFDKNSVTK